MTYCNSKIVWVLICTLVANTAYALIAPFLPLEFMEKGIQEELIGLIFSIYSISIIVFSPMIGSLISKFGTKPIVASGLLSMGIAFVLFGPWFFFIFKTLIELIFLSSEKLLGISIVEASFKISIEKIALVPEISLSIFYKSLFNDYQSL